MARITIAQLSAQLEAAHIAYEKLALERDSLVAEHGLLRTRIFELNEMLRATGAKGAPLQDSVRVMRGGKAFDKVCVGWNRFAYREVR